MSLANGRDPFMEVYSSTSGRHACSVHVMDVPGGVVLKTGEYDTGDDEDQISISVALVFIPGARAHEFDLALG